MNRATAQTLTIKLHATQAYPVGVQIPLTQIGAGQVTVAAEGGVTLRKDVLYTAKMRAQYAKALLEQLDTDVWLLTGNLELA